MPGNVPKTATNVPKHYNYPSVCHAVILKFGIHTARGKSSSIWAYFLYRQLTELVVTDCISVLLGNMLVKYPNITG